MALPEGIFYLKTNFPASLKLVLVHEGGNDDDPRDPGGRTSRGITAGEWAAWRQSHPGFSSDVWEAPQSQVEAIYKQKYWDAIDGDNVVSGLDYCAFDSAVLDGVGRARPWLVQVQNMEVGRAINTFCDMRLARLRGLTNLWSTYGRGWSNRVADVRREALSLTTPDVVAAGLSRKQFAAAIIAAKKRKGYHTNSAPGEIDINYVEGWTNDGGDHFIKNDDASGGFNDLRCVITFPNNEPVLLGGWMATTRPSPYATHSRINQGGTANIWPGQYRAWQVGIHRGAYEALVQRGKLELTRDDNEDLKREGDLHEIGDYEGINQHHAYNASEVGGHSFGCLVGRFVVGHEEFMKNVKSHPAYIADHSHMFETAILEQRDIV